MRGVNKLDRRVAAFVSDLEAVCLKHRMLPVLVRAALDQEGDCVEELSPLLGNEEVPSSGDVRVFAAAEVTDERILHQAMEEMRIEPARILTRTLAEEEGLSGDAD